MWYEFEGENFFLIHTTRQAFKVRKNYFLPWHWRKKFFLLVKHGKKYCPNCLSILIYWLNNFFFSNIKFCTLFRKTLNFCISLILEKKERRIYAESYAYNMYIPTYVYVLFFMSAYMPEVSLSFITMWMNLKVRCPLQDVADMSKLKWEHLKMKMFSGSAERWRYSIRLFSKMSDKREGGVKNLKKWVTSFMDCPKLYQSNGYQS